LSAEYLTVMAPALGLELMLFLFLGLVMLVLVIKSTVIVRPYERGIVERFGKYSRTVGAGLNIILPFIEAAYRVDMREALIDVPSQEVITKDNVNVTVDAVIYFKVMDPFRVMYNVSMFEDAISKLAQTNLRNIIGDMSFDHILASRDKMNIELRKILDEITDRWGVRVTRVEIQDIQPPQDIVEAMGRQMKAERTKRAAVLEAEGVRQADILKAEGKKQSDILSAEGQAKAIEAVAEAERRKKMLLAEGEANAISNVFKAIHDGRPTKDIIMIKYLEALEKMADGKATKIFMPFETSGVLSGAAAIGEMLKGEKGEGHNLTPDLTKLQMGADTEKDGSDDLFSKKQKKTSEKK
jgi:regulator of protease activity HflC (stomatin/prohibitin superfamily)